MNSAQIMASSSSIFVDMYIGPVFDAEKYLELERKLFKVEPRPIPGSVRQNPTEPARSASQSNPDPTIIDGFIEKATKFSCWLDDVLKAPFRAFSRKSGSSKNAGSQKTESGMRGEGEGPEITHPPRVYNPKNMESRHHSRKQAPVNVARTATPKQAKKVAVPETSQEKVGTIRNGLVQALIKKYEELSDVSPESSCRQCRQTNGTKVRSMASAVEPGRTEKIGLLPVAIRGHATAGGSVKLTTEVPKAVRKPTKVASASTIMMGRNAKWRAGKSGVHAKSSDEDNVLDVGDTKTGSSGNKVRHNVKNGGKGGKTKWSKFSGMQRDGVVHS